MSHDIRPPDAQAARSMHARLEIPVIKDTNPGFHQLISALKALTGCPVMVNTFFNVRSQPIVSKPEDAFRCFMATDMDVLVNANCFLCKESQPAMSN